MAKNKKVYGTVKIPNNKHSFTVGFYNLPGFKAYYTSFNFVNEVSQLTYDDKFEIISKHKIFNNKKFMMLIDKYKISNKIINFLEHKDIETKKLGVALMCQEINDYEDKRRNKTST